jgi:hypothetical protein
VRGGRSNKALFEGEKDDIGPENAYFWEVKSEGTISSRDLIPRSFKISCSFKKFFNSQLYLL